MTLSETKSDSVVVIMGGSRELGPHAVICAVPTRRLRRGRLSGEIELCTSLHSSLRSF